MPQDLSYLGKVKKDKVRVSVLVDGSRVVAQTHPEKDGIVKMEKPVRVIIRPVEGGKIGVDMMAMLIGASKHEMDVRTSSIMYTYAPDDGVFELYVDTVQKNQM